jgi:glycosyltransferase involved in cell wall biosynthesis
MKVSAFTYVRNGFVFGYPFIEAIKSVLPIVDECIVVVGDSYDGSREAVEALNNRKIKIIDTVWDEQLRVGGKVFALQANIGMDNASKDADWLFHIQADEVIHEKDLETIRRGMEENLHRKEVDGLLLKFIHFYGDYHHYCPSRRFHQREIRIVRNDPHIRSYKDSMGFRKYNDPKHTEKEKGTKLNTVQIDAAVYHYSWARPPKKQKAKQIEFAKRYHESDDFIAEFNKSHTQEYNYVAYDYLNKFTGTHPAVMLPVVQNQDWKFEYIPEKNNMSFKEKVMRLLEQLTGKQFFIYKNYKVLK